MKNSLDDNKPIFLQIKEQLEDSIINGEIKAGERVPSTNEFAAFYKINPATAAKGINELVVEDILFKRRGVGMFVTDHAKEILIAKRKQTFFERYILPLKEEARKLNITETELLSMMKGDDNNEN
ncbi:GntR family transcriptional regulator [Ornithinibacillus halotolerans]|uniref:GntR family transcriptional regulator n=1 Tax=Ornithinibacillus halotolerans TaxID=1274357 RepID=A0A916S803_9BACI|nr:GntR family transcriptional regulator [Ornithinibacillus halotolerans]GGA89185.1 GntR family transcriptional regulator [Ornithinibacillus halotolerans]